MSTHEASSAAAICPECARGVHVACRDEPGTSADCACTCGEASSAATVCPRCGRRYTGTACPRHNTTGQAPSAAQGRLCDYGIWLLGACFGVGVTLIVLALTGAVK